MAVSRYLPPSGRPRATTCAPPGGGAPPRPPLEAAPGDGAVLQGASRPAAVIRPPRKSVAAAAAGAGPGREEALRPAVRPTSATAPGTAFPVAVRGGVHSASIRFLSAKSTVRRLSGPPATSHSSQPGTLPPPRWRTRLISTLPPRVVLAGGFDQRLRPAPLEETPPRPRPASAPLRSHRRPRRPRRGSTQLVGPWPPHRLVMYATSRARNALIASAGYGAHRSMPPPTSGIRGTRRSGRAAAVPSAQPGPLRA